jgi:hypothetical protein
MNEFYMAPFQIGVGEKRVWHLPDRSERGQRSAHRAWKGSSNSADITLYSAFIVLGNRAVKVVPALLDDVTEIVPPCAITISLVI